jgi:hypothetical protein
MANSSLEYFSLHSVLQILPSGVAKQAVMYDPLLQKLTYHEVELIGLADIGDEEDPLITPCYMCANAAGLFWIPDLQPSFIEYVKTGEILDINILRDKIEEIEKWWATVENDIDPIKVEKKDNVSYIRRKKDDRDRTPDGPGK